MASVKTRPTLRAATISTKLERSFDSADLQHLLATTLGNKNALDPALKGIERPPLPPGSRAFEQAKGELEIERQTLYNGISSLPDHSGNQSPVSHLRVPSPCGAGQRPRSGYRSPNGRLSPCPHHIHDRPRSGRRSPYLGLPSQAPPGRPGSQHRREGARSVSPGPPHFVSPNNSRPSSYCH